jgi:hypothetical protein
VLNRGTLLVSGSLDVSTAVDPGSMGVFKLTGGSTLDVASALGISSKMSFEAGSELIVDDAGLFGQNVGSSHYAESLLRDFGGSTIDIEDFSAIGLTASYSAATGLLQLTNASEQMATLHFQNSSLGGGAFHFSTDNSGGVLITRV